MSQHTQQHSTWRAAHDARLGAHDIWWHYFSISGNLSVFEVDAYLHGMYPLNVDERNLIAIAVNELVDELPGRSKAEFVEYPAED